MTIKENYKELLSDKRFLMSYIASFGMLILALVLNYFAAVYAFESASNPVTDIILSNIPVFNVDAIFIWGPLIFWIILAPALLREPRRIPFTLKSISVFVMIRAFFITLTHLGPFPDQSPMTLYGANWIAEFLHSDPATAFIFSSGADLFFSGHTGLPFLLALIFWKNKGLRVFCLMTSVFFAIVVLLGHLHYTIDVVSAYFITFTIGHIVNHIFKRDRDRFLNVIHS